MPTRDRPQLVAIGGAVVVTAGMGWLTHLRAGAVVLLLVLGVIVLVMSIDEVTPAIVAAVPIVLTASTGTRRSMCTAARESGIGAARSES